jgi:hypothetical protein
MRTLSNRLEIPVRERRPDERHQCNGRRHVHVAPHRSFPGQLTGEAYIFAFSTL